MDNQYDLNKEIKKIVDYSDYYFNKINWQFNDIENIKDIYIKSLILSKIFVMNKNRIEIKFECRSVIDDVPILVFDLIRILGITLDNAIEAALETVNPKVSIGIICNNDQIEFIIENSSKNIKDNLEKLIIEGYSSKVGHLGLGLSNIQEIKKDIQMFSFNIKKGIHLYG